MNKFFTALVISICFILISFPFVFSEDVTITTYFPSPYGSYLKLTSDQIAIGATYRTSVIPTNGLIVQGDVGIVRIDAGTYGGIKMELDVNGEIAANDIWFKNKSKWLSGMGWCETETYGPNTHITPCPSGTTYMWFQPIYGTSPTTYDIPTSGSFLCCS